MQGYPHWAVRYFVLLVWLFKRKPGVQIVASAGPSRVSCAALVRMNSLTRRTALPALSGSFAAKKDSSSAAKRSRAKPLITFYKVYEHEFSESNVQIVY